MASLHLDSIPSMWAIPTTATVRPLHLFSRLSVMRSSRWSNMALATFGNSRLICPVNALTASRVLRSSTALSGSFQSTRLNLSTNRGSTPSHCIEPPPVIMRRMSGKLSASRRAFMVSSWDLSPRTSVAPMRSDSSMPTLNSFPGSMPLIRNMLYTVLSPAPSIFSPISPGALS